MFKETLLPVLKTLSVTAGDQTHDLPFTDALTTRPPQRSPVVHSYVIDRSYVKGSVQSL